MADRIERILSVPAPPETVWDVVTADGWLAEEVRLDLRPGGDAHFRSRQSSKTGWVEEAVAPSRLAFWWTLDDELDDEPATRVELTPDPEHDGRPPRVGHPLVLDPVHVPVGERPVVVPRTPRHGAMTRMLPRRHSCATRRASGPWCRAGARARWRRACRRRRRARAPRRGPAPERPGGAGSGAIRFRPDRCRQRRPRSPPAPAAAATPVRHPRASSAASRQSRPRTSPTAAGFRPRPGAGARPAPGRRGASGRAAPRRTPRRAR